MENNFLDQARRLIADFRGKPATSELRQQAAITLARLLLQEAHKRQTKSEKQREEQLARMINDPLGKIFVTSIADQCFRSNQSSRIADQLVYLLQHFGIPDFLSFTQQTGLQAFKILGKVFPKPMVAIAKRLVRQEASHVILPGESKEMLQHIERRHKQGVRINLNHLGEAILGEEEAENRLQTYLEDLANPLIEYISVKISTLFSQINLLAWGDTMEILTERLRLLYRAARDNQYVTREGNHFSKFVNLDMEEYRDLHLTVELFCKVLEEPEFFRHSAGIVLQSYLPDSFLIQQKLTIWAMQRVNHGGGPIKIRIVKGANLAMEQVEASLHGWPQAPYLSKLEVDANFKRMLQYGCQPKHVRATNLGVGTHNLFDIAYTMLLCAEYEVERFVSLEMLEGMADSIRRAVQEVTGSILLYCPVATEKEFQNAIAYLIRRLDENTAPENFLRYVFHLSPNSENWKSQVNLFSKSCEQIEFVGSQPNRKQNRLIEPPKPTMWNSFSNEPDTDWSLPNNRLWSKQILEKWKKQSLDFPEPTLNETYMDNLLQTAAKGQKEWEAISLAEGSAILAQVAQEMRLGRADLIGAMVVEAAKVISEADSEVSEAIDFAEYYRGKMEGFASMGGIQWIPKGIVLVTPPWNFPCSIPAGGILAALSAGNSVLFKPAPEAVFVGWQLVNLFWKAGVSKEVLQFVVCPDEPFGSQLVKDERVACVVLTGATATAKAMLKMRPGLDLIAETGGKNTLIITSMADRDLAVRDLVQSAFGHAGQKCSACSLAILEAEVYDDPQFRKQLHDAAASLRVGYAFDPSTKVNPLIRAPNPTLLRGLTQLDEGEEWLLQPKKIGGNLRLWSPGIKLGVKEGSFTYKNELFGPVLGLMRAKDLKEALRLANGTPYGLTAGIHTLDEREQRLWMEEIEAGNCYINRGITGAIVQRQPFGGCKASSFGRGAKAGGPNYLLQLMHAIETELPKNGEAVPVNVGRLDHYLTSRLSKEELEIWRASIGSYAYFWDQFFSKDHDPSKLIGEDNLQRYVPHWPMALRVQKADTLLDTFRVMAAAMICGTPLSISVEQGMENVNLPGIKWMEETDQQFADRMRSESVLRIRILSKPNDELEQVFSEMGCSVLRDRVHALGRLELLNYLREVSISISYHRYGNLGERETF